MKDHAEDLLGSCVKKKEKKRKRKMTMWNMSQTTLFIVFIMIKLPIWFQNDQSICYFERWDGVDNDIEETSVVF